ncbi:hypothetical protein BJY52DRAFT_1229674 [Lactarius psammicola]|nr:hypothetical protein BJY52DRAFT_1229674 [Lactarius psammicola]
MLTPPFAQVAPLARLPRCVPPIGYATPARVSRRADLPLLARRHKRDSVQEGRGVHARGRATRKGLHRLERVNGRAGSPMRGSGREPETGDSAPLYARRVGGGASKATRKRKGARTLSAHPSPHPVVFKI